MGVSVFRYTGCFSMGLLYIGIQGVSGGKVSILGGNSIGQYERKKTDMNLCLILHSYPDRAV